MRTEAPSGKTPAERSRKKTRDDHNPGLFVLQMLYDFCVFIIQAGPVPPRQKDCRPHPRKRRPRRHRPELRLQLGQGAYEYARSGMKSPEETENRPLSPTGTDAAGNEQVLLKCFIPFHTFRFQ